MWKMLEQTLGAGDPNASGPKKNSGTYYKISNDFKPAEVVKKKKDEGDEGVHFSQITVMQKKKKGKGKLIE
jgi:hypothetical protein